MLKKKQRFFSECRICFSFMLLRHYERQPGPSSKSPAREERSFSMTEQPMIVCQSSKIEREDVL